MQRGVILEEKAFVLFGQKNDSFLWGIWWKTFVKAVDLRGSFCYNTLSYIWDRIKGEGGAQDHERFVRNCFYP
jgi:hypothetical protein